MAMRRPTIRLNNADLPTFGLPTMAMSPPMSVRWSDAAEFLEGVPHQIFRVALDFSLRRLPASLGQRGIGIDQHIGDHSPRMLPFVNDLIQYARIRMLRSKTQPEQFHSHPRDFLHQRRNIREPPAAEDVQVAEFARQHAKFVLIFSRQYRHREFV